MQVLMILRQIWISGADIYLDKSDGRIAIKKQNLIPVQVMQAAEQNFKAIDEWFQSWKGASPQEVTLMKMIHHTCGWQPNEKLNNWLCSEEESLMMFDEWMVLLAKNGWKDIYDDYRQYENNESNKLAHELYIRAVAYAKKGA